MNFRRTGYRFLSSGSGLSLTTGRYFFESLAVGVVTGFAVVVFKWLIHFADDHILNGIGQRLRYSPLGSGSAAIQHLQRLDFLDWHRWLLLVMPAIGALLGYLIIRQFTAVQHARGTDSAIRAYHQQNGYVAPLVIPVKGVASVLTVGFGGSAGYEGPVTLIGAACGSLIGELFNLNARARRILMAAGLGAGIAALFQAPLAGAIFGFEIFYSSSDVEYETMLPSFIASAVAYTIYACFYGWDPLFVMPPFHFENGLRLFPYFVLAIVVTFGARFYIMIFSEVSKMFSRLRLSGWGKVALGGLLTGIIGFFMPDILGTSYPIIQASFIAGSDHMYAAFAPMAIVGFVGFFFVKAIATACTVGSGGSGGVFAPAIVCGGCLGAAVGLVFNHFLPGSLGIHPAAFALVGMAGFVASAIRIPLTAIVIVAEISGNHALLLPAMWVCGIAFWLNSGWSLYRSQPHNRESSPVHMGKFKG